MLFNVERFKKNGFLLYEDRWKKKIIQILNLIISFPNNISERIKKFNLFDTIKFSRFVIDILKFTKDVTFVVDKKFTHRNN